MPIISSSKDKDQLLLDGFRYRRANKSQSIWCCCKNNYAGRMRFDGFQYVPVTGHNHIAIIYCSHKTQLSGAQLSGAQLLGAQLSGAQLSGGSTVGVPNETSFFDNEHRHT